MRKLVMVRFIFLLITISISGCSFTTNMSGHEYFKPYVGVISELQTDAKLCRVSDDKNFYRYRQLQIVPLQQDCGTRRGSTVATLKKGEEIAVQKVVEHSSKAGGTIYALGRVRGFEFEYFWGGRLILFKAPWEKGEYDLDRCIGTVWIDCEEYIASKAHNK